MGRPSEFDRRQAVTDAMHHVWRNGLEAASVNGLAEVLGITRSSFYNAFGSRDELLREALKVYQEELPGLPDAGTGNADICRQLTAFFRAICRFHARNEWRGCLIANCISEACRPGDPLERDLKDGVARTITFFEALVDQAKATGEVHNARRSRDTAIALQTLLLGLSALAKTTRSETVLWNAARETLIGLGLFQERR